MRLRVSHRTEYRFVPPARGVVQSLRMTPSSFEGQRVLDWVVDVPGAVRGAAFRDGAGDRVDTVSLLGPVSAMEVAVAGEVETLDLSGVVRGHREAVPPLAYLFPTRMTRADRGLAKLAGDSVEGLGGTLDRAHAVAAAVSAAIAYHPGETRSATTGAEALALGRGVCQDFTHALIAGALTLGVPARYVTGYMLASRPQVIVSQAQGQGQGQGQRQGQTQGAGDPPPPASPEDEASHAWAELWIERLGWVGFDAANRCCPDERYIRVGSGFDAADAAPIRGVAQGQAAEELAVTVTVEAVEA